MRCYGQIILLCFLVIQSAKSQHPHYRSYHSYSPHYYPRGPSRPLPPLPPSRISPHLSRIMPIRPIKRNAYQALPKPKHYWNPTAPYRYRYASPYHPQHMVASPSRTPYRVVYAPPPVPAQQMVYPMHSPYRRMSYAPKSASYDMASSGSVPANVRYVPVVKKVTHHHIHHIIALPKSRTHLASDTQSVDKLNSLLLKSLLNSRKANPIDELADSSSQIPVKIHTTEHDTKEVETEHEHESNKNVNHEIVFEDEEGEGQENDQRQFVQLFNPESKSIPLGKDGTPKKTLVYKIDPKNGANEGQYITMMHDLAKSGNSGKQGNTKGPFYSLFLGVPEADNSEFKPKPSEQFDDSSESGYIDHNQQQYFIANRRSDDEVEEVEPSKPKLKVKQPKNSVKKDGSKISDISQKLLYYSPSKKQKTEH